MKRKLLIIIFIILFSAVIIGKILLNKNNNDDSLDHVRLAEVTHSMFYTPMYVAVQNGYFEENGIDIELILTSGADKVSAAVLSGSVDIGFAGPESAIYVYDNGEKDYLVTFAGLTKRDGQFIVSRKKMKDFRIEDLYNKEILVGRTAGMPSINFINGIKNSNGDLSKIKMNTSVDFASLSGSFISGVGDFVNLFDDSAI